MKTCANVDSCAPQSALIVPPIALALAKHPLVDKYDLKSLRTFDLDLQAS